MIVTLALAAEAAIGKSAARGRRPAMAMEVEAAGEPVSLCFYASIILFQSLFIHLSFILFDHPF